MTDDDHLRSHYMLQRLAHTMSYHAPRQLARVHYLTKRMRARAARNRRRR